jgi:hypothetical protein
MALPRAEFHFAVRDLLVRAEVLGTKLEFDRAGFHVEVLFPGNGADRHWPLGALRHVSGKEPYAQGFAVQMLKLSGPHCQDHFLPAIS